MKKTATFIVLFLSLSGIKAQQTIQQSIFLRSNKVNSTEILLYKEDDSSYYDIASNFGGFEIYNSSTNNSPFFIHSNGNVGIGTSTPTYKLSVNGKIRAHEIKVETASWPDYVFAADYKLPTLREIAQHIKEKGHLEGIPSAKEVKSNGIDLGEMNAKLLEKVEELTLHLIAMKKDSDQERLNNLELKDQVKEQEKRIEIIMKTLKLIGK